MSEEQFKEEIEQIIQEIKLNGPDIYTTLRTIKGIGVVVVKSKTVPSGLIIDPWVNPEQSNGT
jgi:hypothetical protein